MLRFVRSSLLATLASTAVAAQTPPPGGAQPPAAGAQAQQPPRRGPRPYAQVITDRAVTDAGAITVHRVEDRWFFEVPDSLLRRDFLMVSRVAAVPSNFAGFTSAGTSIAERVVRWEKNGERIMLRAIGFGAVADDSLPIAISVASNNLGPILASFPIQAFTRDSNGAVLDVTEFFGGDTPALSALNAAQRRTYQVRRLDPARSYINTVRSFPLNVEVRHTQTFDAGEPPSDRNAATLSVEMRQSLVLLPREPMRPRYADERIGFFTVGRVNYGLDEQKAATQTFIRRWRLEPKDPAAYARGELVEPVKPIIYYLDPATPAKWRPFMRRGVEDWQKAFEKAGFKNAIIARDAPTPAQDPEWDPEDIRYSVVRWAASTVRNAVGPSTSDPRSGEIIESDITWYHNHMRSYRNRLMIETGAANPAARTLDIPEDLMGETMRQVITHEVGHALGLPHNMIASASFPVDSLRKVTFTSRYGVSATIMDYARQNYVAQPGDGLAPKDFVRRLGPFDDFIINWGYRAIPTARTAEDERPILNRWYTEQTGPMPYRYLPQQMVGIDPRAQTEDLGDDAVRASGFAVENLKKVVPNLVAWTTTPGEDFTELNEIYTETLGMWSQYMGHVVNWVGGMRIELKTAEQSGPVYQVVPMARQRTALQFLASQAFVTPTWLANPGILQRLGLPAGALSLSNRQAGILTQLFDARRLARLGDAEAMDPANAYPLATYMDDLRRSVFGGTLDANRRVLHRVYLERLEALLAPPTPVNVPAGAPPGFTLPAPVNTRRADIAPLARAQMRSIQADARRLATTATGVNRAHWQDLADRVTDVLERRR
ncbi:MAG: zinc-dependent metalloprotease [Gemmatimonadetes bacterium]|nr:zinc-dependent metalloprotease [Gemmatimonadota bacterium]